MPAKKPQLPARRKPPQQQQKPIAGRTAADPKGHEADLEILRMLADSARSEDADDGFTTAMRHHDRTGQIERFAIYAWGPSAQVLADKFGMQPGNPPPGFRQSLDRQLETAENPRLAAPSQAQVPGAQIIDVRAETDEE